MRKIPAEVAVISMGLLGMFFAINTKGAPITGCQELFVGSLVDSPFLTPSGPGAVIDASGRSGLLNVYVRGQDDHIYENPVRNHEFSGWSEVPGGGLTRSAPAAISSSCSP